MKTIITSILALVNKLENSQASQIIKILLTNLANIITYIEVSGAPEPDLIPTGEIMIDELTGVLMSLAKINFPQLSTGLKNLITEIGKIAGLVTKSIPDFTEAINALTDVLGLFEGKTDTTSASATLHINNALAVLKGTAAGETVAIPVVKDLSKPDEVTPQKAGTLQAGQLAIPGVHKV